MTRPYCESTATSRREAVALPAVVQQAYVEGGSTGSALLAAASSAGANLMVMGAYTHSRMREMIMGGVTRRVLEKTGIPVLMAH